MVSKKGGPWGGAHLHGIRKTVVSGRWSQKRGGSKGGAHLHGIRKTGFREVVSVEGWSLGRGSFTWN